MEGSPSQPRAKRQKVDKVGRFAALQRLKELKGQKNKLEITDEVDNVYDVVDEKEFAKISRETFGDGWIEEDGSGYTEDGRDFFEDEGDYEVGPSQDAKANKKGKKRPREEKQKEGKGSIRSLFSHAVTKRKKEAPVKLEEDDVLADILSEIDTTKAPAGTKSQEKPVNKGNGVSHSEKSLSDAEVTKEYMKNFMDSIRKGTETKRQRKDSSEDEMIERILKPSKVTKKENILITNLDKRTELEEVPKEDKETDSKDKEKQNSNEQIKETTVPAKQAPKSPLKNKGNTQKTEELADDMDYSMLNDEENQFDEDIPSQTIPVSSQTTVKDPGYRIPKPEAKEETVEDLQHLLNNWENICGKENFDLETSTASTTSSPEDGEFSHEQLKMWFWDAWEDQRMHQVRGQVFLFGKIALKNGEFKTACVTLQNIDKVLYLLPREYMLDPITKDKTNKKVTLFDVYQEFNESLAKSMKLTSFRSKKVMKNCAFSIPSVKIPETAEYLEVRYDGKNDSPFSHGRYNTISYIFGTNTSLLETFLLECKIKGPCWLNLKNFRISKTPSSWCKVEIICPSANSISVAEEQNQRPPPICLLTLNVRTSLNVGTNKNEIVMLSCLVNNKFAVDRPPPNPPFNRHRCGFTRPKSQNWPFDLNQKMASYESMKLTKFDTEKALLSWFLAFYHNVDPDMVVTYDSQDCQLDVLRERLMEIKLHDWSRLGRLRFSQMQKRMNDLFIGRLVCDVKRSAEELIKSRSYDLDTVCTNILKLKEGERMDVSNTELSRMYESSAGILKLITLTMQDCSYILRLMCELNVIPLALQITNICGNLMSHTLSLGRSHRNEFLLLHAFTDKNYIVPDRPSKDEGSQQFGQQSATRKKANYAGGLVLEPIKGFYDKFILLMDFNSLYPSIIQEFNICFTTISQPPNPDDVCEPPERGIELGILPRQIRRLVASRREIKKLMAAPDLEPEQKMQYHIRQLALKLTANSMYGCLGFGSSRFFAQHLAALVTNKGREILMQTKSLVEKLGFQVVYGDTDSIMVNTNSVDYDQVVKIGYSIKQTINKSYKEIELDIDGIFKYLLLLKKKKYAALTITKNQKGEFQLNQEHKGLDIVRRDWSQISVMAGKCVLDEILSDNDIQVKIESIHSQLETLKKTIEDGDVPLPMLAITKQLTRNPKEYVNSKVLPHVRVALRMNTERNKRYKKGDMVDYIVCEDGTENPAMQRAYHPEELKSSETLKVDKNYYLAHQIHPVVSRLCEPLEETNASRIGECLGLDPSKFRQQVQRTTTDGQAEGESLAVRSINIYRQCEKFQFTCVTCKTLNIVASAFRPGDKLPVLQSCANSECSVQPHDYVTSIRNQLQLSIRNFIRRFYENWLVCDNPMCNSNTRVYSHVTQSNRLLCMECKEGFLLRQYTEKDLFTQIRYFQYMFDLSKSEKGEGVAGEIKHAYDILKGTIDQVLENSAYSTISLSKIFSLFDPNVVATD